ncbi:helix-turn-helix transcriptional regulator [Brevibacillus halotolerans]|uniref:helix-turn-helix transcriptional regulator n=1 Tax=Brevibacillus halotolerans TaxID=1507437 RepID=UPI0015EECD41|nr:helix-turn-helix transcriptional regulator [Brevibacillus halotolerans]MBA4534381.1 helix-turn-helix transcriptional regulator [Brevibacillus halotolerans]
MMKRISLIAARLEKNKLQRIAAEEIGISTVFLVMLESGKRNPGKGTMNRISNYYQKPAEELFPDRFLRLQ